MRCSLQQYWRLERRPRRLNARWLLPAALITLAFSICSSAQPPTADHGENVPIRQAVKQAAELAYPESEAKQLKMHDRYDLNEEVSGIRSKASPNVSFYSFNNLDSPSDEDSLWAVVSTDSRATADEMYSFESSDSIDDSTKTFNRLLSQLALSVTDNQAISIARFFLDCCIRREPGETVGNDHELRHLVERFYIRIYGDVWRALDSGTQWWQEYEKNAADLRPTIFVANGWRQIVVPRLIVSFGMHPQLQRWDVAVSSDGEVRVMSVEPIFPRQRRWLSYALRPTIGPEIP